MGEQDISGIGGFNAQIPPEDDDALELESKKKHEKKKSTFFSQSTLQKSEPEQIVLNLALGFPMLKPPQNAMQSSKISVTCEKKMQQTDASNPFLQPARSLQPIQADTALKNAEALLTVAKQPSQLVEKDLSDEDKSIRVMLSAMALNMLFRSFVGAMKGDQFIDLLKDFGMDMPEEIKPLIKQHVAVINANLPVEPSAREDAVSMLKDFVTSHDSDVAAMQSTQILRDELSRDALKKEQLRVDSTVNDQFLKDEQTKSGMISSMLATYLTNLREFAERVQQNDIRAWMDKMEEQGTKSPTEYYAHLLTQSASGKEMALETQFKKGFNEWFLNPLSQRTHEVNYPHKSESPDAYPSASFIAGCVVSGEDLVRNAIGGLSVAVNYQMSDTPIAPVIAAVGPPSDQSIDSLAAAALLATLLNNGAAFKAANDTLKKASGKGFLRRDLDFAIHYAKNIINIVKIRSNPPVEKGLKDQNSLIRLMLCTMALNILYRAVYDGMTGIEFKSMLQGDTADIQENIKSLVEQLIALVNENLPDNAVKRSETIERLMKYIDSKDAVNSILQTTRILTRLLGRGDIDQRFREVQSG